MTFKSHTDHEETIRTAGAFTARALNRRQALALLGSSAFLAACSGESDEAASGSETGAAGGGAGSSAGGATSAEGWASGGTRVLSANYPDPFSDPLGSSCSITCRETIGPCYGPSVERRDISEGYPGLPVRLMLLVVDENCEPVAGASVDIWHSRNTGVYSGEGIGQDEDGAPIMFGPPDGSLTAACTGGDPEAASQSYFRGVQTTDAAGRVEFDTCFPGWYAGRAIHIHFIVRIAGRQSVISQLYFEGGLTSEICAVHPDYAPRSQPDTFNETDGFYSGPELVLSAARQSDGSLLAWKTIVLRNSFDDASCGAEPGAGPRGTP
jgi:protocatechuate 3,4-dioxygenase beta subunit